MRACAGSAPRPSTPGRLVTCSVTCKWRHMLSSCARHSFLVLALSSALASGCNHPEGAPPGASPAHPGSNGTPAARTGSGNSEPPKISEAEAERARNDLPSDQRALLVVNGAARWVDAKAIESVGYTLVICDNHSAVSQAAQILGREEAKSPRHPK